MDNYLSKLNFDFRNSHLILREIGIIDSFKGKWNSIEQKKENAYLKQLREQATIESVGSASRLAGGRLTNVEIQELLENFEAENLKSKDQKNVVGYYEALKSVFKNTFEIELSAKSIDQLHQKLFSYYNANEKHIGKYKALSNSVVINYPDGSQKIVFKTTMPYQVEQELAELIDWTNKQMKSHLLHPLMIIGLFIYEFFLIHPYQEGNMRLTLLLSRLLLIKYDYCFIQYISFENRLEQKQKACYDALMDGHKDRYSYEERINKWILYFSQSLGSIITRLDKKQDTNQQKAVYINSRQKRIQLFIKKNQPVKFADLADSMPEISVNTLKKDLLYLKTEKIIKSSGKYRGTLYTVKDK